jgi:hypothetical protein
MGSALLGIGFAGMLALLIYASGADLSHEDASVWGEWWYRITFGVSVAMAAVGAYYLGAVWFGWPTWSTAIERALQPRLVNTTAEAHLLVHPDYVVVKIGSVNAGRGNIDGAMLNVLVPEFITEMERCDERGGTGHRDHMGGTSHTPEALIPYQPNLGSIYWNGNLSYPGRFARIAFFRLRMPGLPHDFPLRLKVSAPELDEPVDEVFHIHVSNLPKP